MLGITGKMGQTIKHVCQESPHYTLIGGWSRSSGGMDQSFSDPKHVFEKAQVIIDVSHASCAVEHAKMAAQYHKPFLVCVTGFEEDPVHLLRPLASTAPLLYAANTSLGITLLKKAVCQIASRLGGEAEVTITDRHHQHKKDAPSGTANMLAEAVRQGRASCSAHASQKEMSEPLPITMTSWREGDVFGDHEVAFVTHAERLVLSHQALSREVFAEGALRLGAWLVHQKPGFYTIDDVYS